MILMTGASGNVGTELARILRSRDVPSEAMRQALLGVGFPTWQADGLVEDSEHYRRGEAADMTSTVQEVTGRAARSIAQFARDYATVFS